MNELLIPIEELTKIKNNFIHELKKSAKGEPTSLRKGFLDGVLLRNTKEHDFTTLIGEEVGLAIEEEVKKKFNKEIHVSVANDTVCAALSGLNQFEPTTIASFVAGTGVN